jgi:SM-20-related protein
MPGLNWPAIEAANLARQPFNHFLVAQALDADCAHGISTEYPAIRSAGSFSLADAPPGPVLAGLIEELRSDRFTAEMERIFDLDLAGRPCVVTLRGQCSARDGRIHTDSRSKLLSLLLYLNEGWQSPEGRLRLLRSPDDIDDYAVEVPPNLGSLVGFSRSDGSWHGHTTFVGPRRVLQLNYLQSATASWVGDLRHRLSAFAKQRVA